MSGILKSTLQLLAEWRALLTPSDGGVLSQTAVARLGATGLYGGQKQKDDSAASDANILNSALGGEFGAVAAYQLAADSGLLQKPVLDLAMLFQGQHKAHADLLTKTVKTLGGTPAEPKKIADYNFAIETLKTQMDVLRFAAGLEQGNARQMTEETISMKLTWHGHSAFRIEAGAAKILIDPFVSDNPSWHKGWIGSRAGEDSTRGGER